MAVQKSADLIEIYLKLPPELRASIEAKVSQSLTDLFERYNCKIPQINYREYEARTERYQKLRRVKRTIPIR